MFRSLALLLFGVTTCVASSEVPLEAAHRVELPVDPLPDCIEAVVLANFREYRPRDPGPSAEDEIILRWTWDVDIGVREVYLGDIRPGRLTIGATLHTSFDDQLKRPVLFLTRRFDMWYLADIEFAARDASGSWVLPMFEEPDETSLTPRGWLPHDYAKWLKPVRYRGSDVAAFEDLYDDEPPAEDEWLRVAGGRKIAKRGFRLKDIPAMLEERRAIECAREKPGGETARP
jgi:hypothetical protein